MQKGKIGDMTIKTWRVHVIKKPWLSYHKAEAWHRLQPVKISGDGEEEG
jgi:hypothetical protein